MDPLSITAAVVGITTAIVQVCQIIDKIKEAPETLKSVKADLAVFQPVLQNLKQTAETNSSQLFASEDVVQAVKNCERACIIFRTRLERWTKHSTEDKMFWSDRWRVGLFGVNHIKTFRGQLTDCKATISVAVSTASIFSSSRQEHMMQEVKDMILQQNEVVLQRRLTEAYTTTEEIEQDMRISFDPVQFQEAEENRQELLQELRNQQSTHQIFVSMCEEALSQTIQERTGVKIKGLKATNHGRNIAGIVNTPGGEKTYEVDISDIVSDSYGINVAGVVNGFDFRDFYSARPGEDDSL